MPKSRLLLLVLTVAALAVPSAAQAASHTWVSGVGDDVNPCSRTAPCQTFAGAISKTDAGGVISVLDSGGFGAVTITKAITIDAQGRYAGVLTSGTNGIVVNAPATADVVLRGLTIDASSPCSSAGSTHGIRFLAGGTLHVEDVTARGFAGAGLDVEPTADGATVTVSGSRLRDNCTAGLLARRTGGSVTVLADRTFLASNATGIRAGAGATIRATGTTVVRNATGLAADAGGQLLSFGDNRVGGNVADGAPTARIDTPAAAPPTTTTTTTTTVTTTVEVPAPAPAAADPIPTVPTTTTPAPALTRAPLGCRVPWLVGLTLTQARKALSAARCKLGTVSHQVRSRVRDGRVRKQSPKAGASYSAGRKVAIAVNPTRKAKKKAKAAVGGGATRTWVSGVGDDANPCSRTAPCQTFAGALNKTATGGTVDVLDPGSFGPATVDGAVTIDAAGFPATVLASAGGSGITVSAPAGAVVTLRGLTIVNPGGCSAAGSGHGVRMLTGGTLHLEDVVAGGFAGAGVSLTPSGDLLATIQGGRFDGNCTAGLSATRPGGSVDVSVLDTLLSGDAVGVLAGAGAQVRLGGSTLTDDGTALSATGGGALAAWPDNAISGNGSDGDAPLALALV